MAPRAPTTLLLLDLALAGASAQLTNRGEAIASSLQAADTRHAKSAATTAPSSLPLQAPSWAWW